MTLPALAAPSSGPRLVVKTKDGKIQGKLSSDGLIRTFLGIPYAAPPVGPLRWKPPQKVKKWKGVLQTTSFGHRCIQTQNYDMVFRDLGQSEDCLTLNVWAPVERNHKKLPVMVWIYGGGFTGGATSEPRQDGTHLAEKGVIVVSMNYRLGIFGFFATAALADESPHHAAGNYGLLDQTAALRWVHDNIKSFGGDPASVTIFGESAGSFSVSLQMASPLARGLFVRAIGESGGAFPQPNFHFPLMAKREAQDEGFAKAAFGTTALQDLRGLSVDQILGALKAGPQGHRVHFGPNVDGWFLPESVPAIYAEGKQAQVPLLAGWNRDEGAANVINTPPLPTVESWRATAEKQFGSNAPEFLKLYPGNTDQQALRSAEDFSGDVFIVYSTWEWLEAQAKTSSASVYRYFFVLPAPVNPTNRWEVGAFHSDDIEYVFGTLNSRQGVQWRPEDYALSRLIQTYWTNFAKTGDPNGASVPHWPTYNAADDWQVMHLGPAPKAQPDQYRDRYLFLQRVWSHGGGAGVANP